MKKQSITQQQQIAPATVAALLEQSHKPLASHISVPTQTRSSTPEQLQEMSISFTKALNHITPTELLNHQTNDDSSQQSELNFGAPQIDLALPKGTFPVSGLHEFNPKYWRDQIAALTCTIALAVRQREQQQTKTPIYCFLSKEQTQLIQWVTTYQTSAFNLKPQDLIIITANHSDDLLWAIEETMHATNGAPIIAHFNLLDNLSAQRLSFLAKTQQTPCFVICNHKIDGPKHAHSQWTIHQHPESKTTIPSLYLSLNQTNKVSTPLGWHLKWQQEQQRFAATREKSAQQSELTLH